jgi:hypothetical protein
MNISTWWRKYRIVSDQYLGYEVQIWKIYWPFWIQCDFCNTFISITAAENFAKGHAKIKVKNL